MSYIEYPSFLPCPTWRYTQGSNQFAARTPMASGHVRQRKNGEKPYTQMGLTFRMNTLEYSRWQQWVNANGYTWFSMKLEEILDVAPLIDLRFTGPVNYQYEEFDRVTITVSAEQETSKL